MWAWALLGVFVGLVGLGVLGEWCARAETRQLRQYSALLEAQGRQLRARIRKTCQYGTRASRRQQ